MYQYRLLGYHVNQKTGRPLSYPAFACASGFVFATGLMALEAAKTAREENKDTLNGMQCEIIVRDENEEVHSYS